MLTDYFIKKKIESIKKESERRPCRSLSLAEAHSLLILYCEEDHEAISKILDSLRKKGKIVKTCVFIASKEATITLGESDIALCAKRDLDMFGVPSAQIMKRIEEERADILINLAQPKCKSMRYVALAHPCSFKVGLKHVEEDCYDMGLIANDQDDIAYLFEQLLSYLRSIHSPATV